MKTAESLPAQTTPIPDVALIVDRARAAFLSGRTKSVAWRRETLKRLSQLLIDHEVELLDALAADFGKPRHEAWVTELGFTTNDIDHTLANLDAWMRPNRVPTPVASQPGSSKIISEPLGVVTVISPWNYPVQLLLVPAVAAIAAGNAVVLKPSELVPHTDAVLARLVRSIGDDAIGIVQGGVAETTELLAQRVDHIIYTGNGRVARIVMRAAAEHLTPVTLELGGKSPVVVTGKANLDVAAKRIAWGKFLNAGQTCIAPDYVLVEPGVRDELVDRIKAATIEFYGSDASTSPDYTRIVNDAHFERLAKYLHDGDVAFGGATDPATRFIAPTVLTGVNRGDSVMQEEIFGPILPVIDCASIEDAVAFINADDKPLALYVFSQDDSEAEAVIAGTSSGGVCVNGTVLHIGNPNLPFGGVGESGTGAYHGRAGFDAFSHHRSVLTRSTKIDPPMLYPPYDARKQRLVRRAFTIADPRDVVARVRSRVGRLLRRSR